MRPCMNDFLCHLAECDQGSLEKSTCRDAIFAVQ